MQEIRFHTSTKQQKEWNFLFRVQLRSFDLKALVCTNFFVPLPHARKSCGL
jgi:hypothetical protein